MPFNGLLPGGQWRASWLLPGHVDDHLLPEGGVLPAAARRGTLCCALSTGGMGPTRDVAHAVSTTLAADSSIDPQVLRWMPVAVPMAAVLLCAGIALIWVLA